MTTILTVPAAGEQQPTAVLAHVTPKASMPHQGLQRHPHVLLDDDEWEQLVELDDTIPQGFLGTQRGWSAWVMHGNVLVIERRFEGKVTHRYQGRLTLASAKAKKGRKRGRYVLIDSHTFPDWLRDILRNLMYIPEGKKDGRVYAHRVLVALWTGKNLNPKDQKALQVHHRNEDPRDNRLENLVPLTEAEHAQLHVDYRWGMNAYNEDGVVGSETCKLTEADFVWLEQFLAEKRYGTAA